MANPLPPARHPDPRLLAFALSIVRSKPGHLSITEHLECMRKNIVHGPRQHGSRHLDAAGLWKSHYEQSQQDLKAARGETEALRLELEELRAETARSSKSRKNTGAKSSSPVKPLRSSYNKAGPATVEVLEAVDVQPMSTPGTRIQGLEALLLRHVYHIHAVFDQQVKLDTQELAYHLIGAAQAVVDVIRQSVEDAPTDNNTAKALEANLVGLMRIVSYLFIAIARLSRSSRGPETEGKVVFALVDMFSHIFATMSEAAMRFPSTDTHGPLPERRSARLVAAEKSKTDANVPQLLTRFLCTIITRLDPKIAVHRHVLEGCSFCVIQKAGSRLYLLTFGHRRRETLEEEMAHSATLPAINTEPAHDTRGPSVNQASALDVPYLLQVVKHTSQAIAACEDPDSFSHLGTTAKEKLKRTLMACTFGTEGLDENHPFLDCLKLPMPPLEAIPAQSPDISLPEWYAQELWGWIGWDILQSEFERKGNKQTSMSM